MAKIKEPVTEGTETLKTDGGVAETETTQTSVNTEETETQSSEIKTEETPVETKTETVETKAKEELPEIAKKMLELFPGEKELYIDRQGGVFKTTSKPTIVKNAILYKNPYYNK